MYLRIYEVIQPLGEVAILIDLLALLTEAHLSNALGICGCKLQAYKSGMTAECFRARRLHLPFCNMPLEALVDGEKFSFQLSFILSAGMPSFTVQLLESLAESMNSETSTPYMVWLNINVLASWEPHRLGLMV